MPDRDAKLSSVITQTAFISVRTWGKALVTREWEWISANSACYSQSGAWISRCTTDINSLFAPWVSTLADPLCMFLFKEENWNTPVINLSLQTPEPSVVVVVVKLQEIIENGKKTALHFCLYALHYPLNLKPKCFILTEAAKTFAWSQTLTRGICLNLPEAFPALHPFLHVSHLCLIPLHIQGPCFVHQVYLCFTLWYSHSCSIQQ